MFHGLSETLLKLTSPGVPDIYQGNEIWTFDLVDPDNRRPVDYERRLNLLRELPEDVEGRDGAVDARKLLDHLEKLGSAVAVVAAELDEFECLCEHGATSNTLSR